MSLLNQISLGIKSNESWTNKLNLKEIEVNLRLRTILMNSNVTIGTMLLMHECKTLFAMTLLLP